MRGTAHDLYHRRRRLCERTQQDDVMSPSVIMQRTSAAKQRTVQEVPSIKHVNEWKICESPSVAGASLMASSADSMKNVIPAANECST